MAVLMKFLYNEKLPYYMVHIKWYKFKGSPDLWLIYFWNQCRIRSLPTFISKIKWLGPELPLNTVHLSGIFRYKKFPDMDCDDKASKNLSTRWQFLFVNFSNADLAWHFSLARYKYWFVLIGTIISTSSTKSSSFSRFK